MEQLTPKTVVAELNKYIVGQDEAKRAVAIALRNRIRRLKLDDEMREEVKPKNLLMIGPTGVGKTEIARRLAAIAQAPFVKVEATKYTEVGYVGRDVESMVRDLVENSIRIVKSQQHELVKDEARAKAIEQVAKALRPGQKVEKKSSANNGLGMFGDMFKMMQANTEEEPEEIVTDEVASSRRQIRQQIRDGLFA